MCSSVVPIIELSVYSRSVMSDLCFVCFAFAAYVVRFGAGRASSYLSDDLDS